MQFKEKFGLFPKKNVMLVNNVVHINEHKIPLIDVKSIYYRPGSFFDNQWGSVFFSFDGKDWDGVDVFEKNAFKFTKKQTDKVNDLLDLIDLPIIEILQDQDDSILTKKSDQITCIHCRSSNIQFMQNNRKSFSVGKAVGGAALTGGIGTLAGFAGKKGKDQWFCQDCNTVFEI